MGTVHSWARRCLGCVWGAGQVAQPGPGGGAPTWAGGSGRAGLIGANERAGGLSGTVNRTLSPGPAGGLTLLPPQARAGGGGCRPRVQPGVPGPHRPRHSASFLPAEPGSVTALGSPLTCSHPWALPAYRPLAPREPGRLVGSGRAGSLAGQDLPSPQEVWPGRPAGGGQTHFSAQGPQPCPCPLLSHLCLSPFSQGNQWGVFLWACVHMRGSMWPGVPVCV